MEFCHRQSLSEIEHEKENNFKIISILLILGWVFRRFRNGDGFFYRVRIKLSPLTVSPAKFVSQLLLVHVTSKKMINAQINLYKYSTTPRYVTNLLSISLLAFVSSSLISHHSVFDLTIREGSTDINFYGPLFRKSFNLIPS